jgi:hypothetical protein
MSQVREAVIGEYLKALRLPAFARSYQELARQAADGGWAYEDYLRELLENDSPKLYGRMDYTSPR